MIRRTLHCAKDKFRIIDVWTWEEEEEPTHKMMMMKKLHLFYFLTINGSFACHAIHPLTEKCQAIINRLNYYITLSLFPPKITIIMRIRNVRVLLIKINIIIRHTKKCE